MSRKYHSRLHDSQKHDQTRVWTRLSRELYTQGEKITNYLNISSSNSHTYIYRISLCRRPSVGVDNLFRLQPFAPPLLPSHRHTAPYHLRGRYAACFSKTEEPDWRVIGDPALGPGTYAIERAEALTFPAPLGGAGDADPSRPSLPFRMRYTPFDTQQLADGYKTLRPRFSTPRSFLYASELSGGIREAAVGLTGARLSAATLAEKTAGGLIEPTSDARRKRLSPAAKVTPSAE